MDLIPQLRRAILAQSLPPPSQTLLTTLTSRSPPPPIPSLLATAKARLLASDLTNTSGTVVDPSMPVFPPNIDSATVQESTISQNTHVQVLDIENLSLSRWEQVEELEAIERGERTRGRQVIRTQASRAGAGAAASGGANAVHRLVLQDGRGKKVFAVELKRISGIGIGKTHIGEKILLRAGAVVARGTVLLTPETCTLLGGKIEAWHESWMEGRLARLRESVGADRPQ
ncbi:recQ mediated genome instability protein domain-containing protein [Trichoderma breve]|uniref:RecQ-mediated genome instability protein 1 n=1 Tax=Trichoderma breve TaxID=2034170 RepID=A0A9W9E8Y2_9HYPO|nr:recQ mediated genome instability protein domain-containing protein [Trichoderma breve]KAJ4862130.1 recQ mediated genome instability protein domain-containing protein [Trichoderma breve]